MYSSVSSSMLVAISVFAIYIDKAKDGYLTHVFNGYAQGGLLGNDSFTGVYLLFNVFFILYLIFNLKKKYSKYLLGIPLLTIIFSPIFFNFNIFLGLISFKEFIHNPLVVLGSARGATLSLMLGVLLATLLVFINHSGKKIRIIARILLGIFLSSIVVFLLLISLKGNYINKKFVEETGGFRQLYWHQAFMGIQDHPVLGWGMGNFSLVNEKYFDTKVLDKDYLDAEKTSDKAHNIVLDTLINTGILGLLAYIMIYILSLRLVWNSGKINKYNKAIFSGLLFAYLLQNMVFFDVLVSYIMFAFLLVIISVLSDEKNNISTENNEEYQNFNFKKIILLFTVITLCFIFSVRYFVFLPAQETIANKVFYDLPSETRGYSKQELDFSNFGTSKDTENYALSVFFSYLNNFNYILNDKANHSAYIKDIDLVIKKIAINSISGGLTYSGSHIMFQLYDLRYQLEPQDTLLPTMRLLSENEILLSPNNVRGYIDKARVFYYEKKYDEAMGVLESVILFDPNNVRIHSIIIEIAKKIGDKKLVKEKIERAKNIIPEVDFK